MEVRACAKDPMLVIPAGRAISAEGGVAVHRGDAKWSCPDWPSRSGVSSQATYGARRAVGTHYGPTQTHLAKYSLRHQRDGNAGTRILYRLRNRVPPLPTLEFRHFRHYPWRSAITHTSSAITHTPCAVYSCSIVTEGTQRGQL